MATAVSTAGVGLSTVASITTSGVGVGVNVSVGVGVSVEVPVGVGVIVGVGVSVGVDVGVGVGSSKVSSVRISADTGSFSGVYGLSGPNSVRRRVSDPKSTMPVVSHIPNSPDST